MESPRHLEKGNGSIGSTASKKMAKSNPESRFVDSQRVKTYGASEERGFDGGKKTKGRKRHIVVDTMENIVQVMLGFRTARLLNL